jgi:hypothetical protein
MRWPRGREQNFVQPTSDGGRERVVTAQGVCNLPLTAPNQGTELPLRYPAQPTSKLDLHCHRWRHTTPAELAKP